MPPKKARGRGKPKEYTASAETGPSGVEPNASIASSLTHTTSGRGRGRAAKSTAMLSATDESPIEEEGAVGGVEIAKLLEEKLVFAEVNNFPCLFFYLN